MESVQRGGEPAIIGHVGRKGLSFCLTDRSGRLDLHSLRDYRTADSSSVSGSMLQYQRDLSIPRLPSQASIAVAGLARGEAISVTHTRWYVSRSGLRGMLSRAPIILNDFEATAWALHRSQSEIDDGQQAFPPTGGSASYCVIGVTAGLGVSVLQRDMDGFVSVLATEAGNAGFAPASREIAEVAARLFPDRFPLIAESVISEPGLVAIYRHLTRERGGLIRDTSAETIAANYRVDPVARQACDLLCGALWSYVSSLVLSYGAWDGVFVTGALAQTLRPVLERADMQVHFVGSGKYARQLRDVPRRICNVPNAELVGAAEALRHRRVRSV